MLRRLKSKDGWLLGEWCSVLQRGLPDHKPMLFIGNLAGIRQQLMLQLGEFDQLKQMHREIYPEPVSYTHLTLPTIYSV